MGIAVYASYIPNRFNGDKEAYVDYAREYQRAYRIKNLDRINRVRNGEEPKRHHSHQKNRRIEALSQES
jgi:hypothetical protein